MADTGQAPGFNFGFGQTPAAPETQDNGPDQISRPKQYPTATRIENGTAYDISGKALGPVGDQDAAQPKPASFNFGFGEKHDFGFGNQDTAAEAEEHRGIYDSLLDFAKARNLTMTGAESLTDLYNKVKNYVSSTPPPTGAAMVAEAASPVPLGPAKDFAKGAWSAQQHETDVARKWLAQPDIESKIVGAARYVQGGIPIAGPILGAIEDHMVKGEYSKAAGVASTLLTPEALEDTGSAISNVVKGAADKVGDLATSATNHVAGELGISNDFNTVVKNIAKPTAKQYQAYQAKIANVSDDLQAILNDSKKPVEQPQQFADAIDKHIQNYESQLQQEAGATKGSSEPVVPGIQQRISGRLDQFFDENKGLYGDETQVDEAKKKVLEGILQSRNGEHLLEPNLFEAENIRRRLNREGKPQFATNATPTTDAYKAGALEAASELRDAIDESFEQKGIQGVQDWRTKEANLIDIRDRLKTAQKKADDLGEPGLWKSMINKVGAPATIIAAAFGHPIGAAAIASGVLMDYLHQKGTNPIANVIRAADIAKKNVGVEATVPERIPVSAPGEPQGPIQGPQSAASITGIVIPTNSLLDTFRAGSEAQTGRTVPVVQPEPVTVKAPPVNHGLYGELSTHYGQFLGTTPYTELEQRFMSDVYAKQQAGKPLLPAEKQLLSKVNQHLAEQRSFGEQAAVDAAEQAKENAAKAAEQQQKLIEEEKAKAEQAAKDSQKAAEDAEREKQDRISKGLVTNIATPFPVGEELPVPDFYEGIGYNGPRIRAHEAGHQIMVDDAGYITGDVISHLHDKAERGSLAEARWDKTPFMNEKGKLDFAKIKENLPDVLAILYGGPVAEEIAHDVPLSQNYGAGTDINNARSLLRDLGFKPTEWGMMLKAAEMRAREVLTAPGVSDIIKRYTGSRQADLEEGLHMHPETIGQMVQEVRSARGGGNALGNEESNVAGSERSDKEGNAGRKGGAKSGDAKALQAAGEAGTRTRSGETGSEAESRSKVEGYKPSEKAATMSAERKDYGPEFDAAQKQHEIDRNKSILRNPKATEEDRRVATETLLDLQNPDLAAVRAYIKAEPKGFDEQKFPHSYAVEVKWPDGMTHTDEVKGLNEGHALWRAKNNWEGADVKISHETTPENVLKTNIKAPERTTGVPEHDSAIKEGGGVPAGVMDLGEFGKIVMFHDPISSTTLGFKNGETITPEKVREKIEASRAQYAAAGK